MARRTGAWSIKRFGDLLNNMAHASFQMIDSVWAFTAWACQHLDPNLANHRGPLSWRFQRSRLTGKAICSYRFSTMPGVAWQYLGRLVATPGTDWEEVDRPESCISGDPIHLEPWHQWNADGTGASRASVIRGVVTALRSVKKFISKTNSSGLRAIGCTGLDSISRTRAIVDWEEFEKKHVPLQAATASGERVPGPILCPTTQIINFPYGKWLMERVRKKDFNSTLDYDVVSPRTDTMNTSVSEVTPLPVITSVLPASISATQADSTVPLVPGDYVWVTFIGSGRRCYLAVVDQNPLAGGGYLVAEIDRMARQSQEPECPAANITVRWCDPIGKRQSWDKLLRWRLPRSGVTEEVDCSLVSPALTVSGTANSLSPNDAARTIAKIVQKSPAYDSDTEVDSGDDTDNRNVAGWSDTKVDANVSELEQTDAPEEETGRKKSRKV